MRLVDADKVLNMDYESAMEYLVNAKDKEYNNTKEAIKTVGGWISEETHKRKYDDDEIIKLSEALITLRNMVETLEN